MSYSLQQRTLPPIAQPGTMGLKSKNMSGNRVLYSVEGLATRASSVPLRSNEGNRHPPHQQQQPHHLAARDDTSVPRLLPAVTVVDSNPAAMIDSYFTSSNHPSVKGVANWKKLLDTEKSQFQSVSMWGELMLQKVVRETAHLQSPNNLRTAVCCMLLHKIAPLMGSAEQLMMDLLKEVYNSIYFSWEQYLQDKYTKQSSGSRENDGGAVVDEDNEYDQGTLQLESSRNDPTSLKYLVSSLNHRFTYFQLLDELQSARVKVVGLPSRVLVRCMDLWRKRLLLVIFTDWLGETRRQRSKKKKLLSIVEHHFQKKCRNRLAEHMAAWRNHVLERRHRNIQDHEATQKKLQQRMGRRIQQLEKENEELKEQLASLRTAHTGAAIQITNMLSLLEKFKHYTSSLNEGTDQPDTHDDADGAKAERATVSPTEAMLSASQQQRAQAAAEAEAEADAKRHNVAVLFPEVSQKRRSASSPPNMSPEDIQNAEAAAKEAMQMPNRLSQLVEFLNADPSASVIARQTGEASAESAKAQTGAGDSSSTANLQPEGDADGEASKTQHPQTISRANYADVLDWVSMRSQMLVMSMQPHSQGLRRCTNFTIDFRDSMRLACLLVSLGTDRTLVDDCAAIADLTARAELVVKVAKCFFNSKDPSWSDISKLEAIDFTKAKGSKISKLLFGLHAKFHSLPVVLANGAPTDEIALALRDAGGYAAPPLMKPIPITTPGHEDSAFDLTLSSNPSPTHRSIQHFGEMVEELIPERQFATWFRELAAPDSDDDATNFFDVTLGGSITGAVSEKMQRRMSRLSFRGSPVASPSSRSKRKSRNQELTEAMIRWVRQKISLQHEGGDVPNFSSMSGADVLFCVLQSMFPKLNLDSRDPNLKLRRMQECLSKKLHLTKVTLGKELLAKAGEREEDVCVPLKELLLMLFFFDQQITVNV